MEQVRQYVCKECASSVPPGHKFCGVCGANVPEDILERQDQYFGEMQQPGKARLILIRGDQGVEGLSYLLHGNKHIVGREDAQIVFPEDDWLDPRHANFFYRDGTLMVRDEGSTNGVYFRVRDEVQLRSGDQFLCGQQLFRVEHAPKMMRSLRTMERTFMPRHAMRVLSVLSNALKEARKGWSIVLVERKFRSVARTVI